MAGALSAPEAIIAAGITHSAQPTDANEVNSLRLTCLIFDDTLELLLVDILTIKLPATQHIIKTDAARQLEG